MTAIKKRPLYLPFAGPALLEAPLLNKGSAFSEQERRAFNLEGLLPHNIETIDEQEARAYDQYCAFDSNIDKHIYLRNIQDTNETAYFRLLANHLEEMLPIIYTPTVGEACQRFSKIYRRKRGLFIAYPDRDRIDDMLQNATKQNVKVIVVTDGERILGLGDLGIGGMGIPIGKLALYTACGGISSAYTLPVVLDVGTNNQDLIDDPMYMGWRNKRVTGPEYFAFVEQFIQAVKMRWPDALLQFEDFAGHTATPLLNTYRDQLCCFNDDIQGTAAVTVGTLLAACKAKGESLKDQRVVFCGAGSAGCGIAGQIIMQMVSEGLTDREARDRIFMVNQDGLLTEKTEGLLDFQHALCHDSKTTENWSLEGLGRYSGIGLYDVVANTKPTILIGVSGVPGLFTKDVIEVMYSHCPKPIVFPLSNPTSRIEGQPVDILRWTRGDAVVATGSPFDAIDMGDVHHEIAQCNNSYIFPGIGLGIIASKAKRITDNIMMASSRALAECSPLVKNGSGSLLPPLSEIRSVSKYIAKVVYLQAIEDGLVIPVPESVIDAHIAQNFWEPVYREYRRTSF